MGELLKQVKAKFRRWHFEQTRKYSNALDATYECIQQLEEKDKEEENTEEVVNKKKLKKRQNRFPYHKKDETTPIKNWIGKQKIVVDPTNKGKAKEQKVENKD